MTDVELVQCATEFRQGILGDQPSDLMCAAVSWPLAGFLRFSGVPCEAVEGDLGHCNHVWIKLADGRALDATADQFNRLFPQKNYPPVYLGEMIDIHAEVERGCTCHPDDSPPVPCARKYALTECRAAMETDDASE